MKMQLTLFVCLFFAATGTMAQTGSETPGVQTQTRQAELSTWRTYTVDGERFSVTLPTVPAMTTDETFFKELNKLQRTRTLGVYADGVVYSVYVWENIKRQSLETFIAEQRGENSDRSTERIVNAGGITGKEYSANRNMPVTMQFFATEGHLYKFSAAGAPADDAAVKQFFSSIVIGKNAKGIEVSDGPGLPFSEQSAEIVSGKQVDTKVRLVMKPEPRYTERARQQQITGTVVLKVVFSSSGSVVNISTLSELPGGLTDQAIAAARKIKFIPAIKDGKYVSMWMQLEYNFNLY